MKRCKCVQCGKNFSISDSEIAFYESKSLSLPKRCKECRQKNKSGNAGRTDASPEYKYKKYTVNAKDKKSSVAGGTVFAVALLAALAGYYFNLPTVGIMVITLIGLLLCALIAGRPRKVLIEEFDTSVYPYTFYDTESMVKHYVKHGKDLPCNSMEQYLRAANLTIKNPASQYKKQAEDGDHVYFYDKTGDFVVVAKAGYIRTYYRATQKYFNKQ